MLTYPCQPNTACGSAKTCAATYTQSRGITFGFHSEIAITEWLSGGFSVELSYESGSAHNCEGEKGETVCVWYENLTEIYIAVFSLTADCHRYQTVYTAYTVQNVDGCKQPTSRPFVLFSPNKNQDIQYARQFYYVVGTCRSNGQGYWDLSGPAGGPPA